MSIIKLDHITKIEGHANLYVKIQNDKVKELRLEAVEGARYFEGFLKGRKYDEVHHIASRICGVCSQSHLLCALKAIENALGVKVSEQTTRLRKLILMGSILQSHLLHLYFLALPDYFGFESALAMTKSHKDTVLRGLKLKKLANDICTIIGGRDVHCITPIIGGFSKLPTQKALNKLLERLKESRQDVIKTAKLFISFKNPSFARKKDLVSLKSDKEYALWEGHIASIDGISVPFSEYHKHLQEQSVKYSSAKFVTLNNNSFMVGAVARISNNKDKLTKSARNIIQKNKLTFPCDSPFMNNVAQAIELMHLTDTCIALLEDLKLVTEDPVKYNVKAGTGIAALEVPRGTVYHEYELNGVGEVVRANIISPTTQNLLSIEEDVKQFLPTILKKHKQRIILDLEKLIRAYDPCISCSAHFLEVELDYV
ncbi:Ni/Fe hydrogenase subunit alpha [Candidatus Woesearchaeota archaeon]|nr:Ni/Fe hydrogenase subunit alpha [Candidatus Woesearchaeota archaeon]